MNTILKYLDDIFPHINYAMVTIHDNDLCIFVKNNCVRSLKEGFIFDQF